MGIKKKQNKTKKSEVKKYKDRLTRRKLLEQKMEKKSEEEKYKDRLTRRKNIGTENGNKKK